MLHFIANWFIVLLTLSVFVTDLVRNIAAVNIDGNYRTSTTQGHPLYLELLRMK